MFLINLKFLTFFGIIVHFYVKNVKCEQEQEIYTAVSDMELMISTESILIENYQNYLNAAETKLNNLKRALKSHKTDYTELTQQLNQTNEIKKSMALYKFLSKFTRNFYELEDLSQDNLEEVIIKNVTNVKKTFTYPSSTDLHGGIIAISRLQDVYNLSIENLLKLLTSKTDIKNSKFGFTDFYLVGIHLFNDNKLNESEPWLKKALDNYIDVLKLEPYEKLSKTHLYELLGWINYKKNKFDVAIEYLEIFLELKPNTTHIENNLIIFKNEKEVWEKNQKLDLVTEVNRLYKIGCRNELERPVKILSLLNCWYLNETNLFLKYAPIKVEELNFDPEMFLFHDVIYDSEIKILQNLVKGKMIHAKVWDTNKGSEYKAEYRTNKLAWLTSKMDPVIDTIKNRIFHMTDLSMSTAEELQIGNYGMGGHYEPHHDFHRGNGKDVVYPIPEWANRLSTLIFYLSDVKHGGATVFPLLNITIFPQKGSALYWYNLFSTGTGDLRTYHGACPVLEGDKWNGDDLHSSVTALQDVLNTEKHLLDTLASYITGTEKKIDTIKSFLSELKNDHTKLLEEGFSGRTIEDPLHAFLITKRLTINVPNLQDYLNATNAKMVENFTKTTVEHDLPGTNDLDGVTLGLLRIQEVYKVTAEEIAEGMMKDINFGSKFTASDCFQVAVKLKDLDFPYYAIQWYKMAIKRIEEEGWKGITPVVDEILALDHLAYAQYLEGSIENTKAAIDTSLKALNKDYNNPSALHIVSNLKSFIEHYIALKTGVKESTALDPPKGALSRYNVTELELLKKGCRGELIKSPAEQRKLFCKYETKNHPFLKLAPIKVEVMNLEPYLVVFHDVIYDSEIEILKELSLEKLVRAGVWNENKGKGEASAVRTSKFAWFNNSTHPLIHVLNQRVSDMTGLSMETAEDFQLMNYGIGGHYDIHPDYFREPKENSNIQRYGLYENGNRIATVLFYMSDVEHGGGTVWPNINVLTLPKKGAAAFWYNLYADGEPNSFARHSACPIIAGSKWVINKWIRIRAQEFRRPCKTYPDSLGSKI